ncbi:IS110 family transposase domain protein (plasmid) [Candidatus Trichorickettsia mobilis]|nr:IS110 family transposase domain protein [Candidatus Trichorickettsia mobilis]
MQLLLALSKNNITVHRTNSRNVKKFIQSFVKNSKTDALDAKTLVLYGFERCSKTRSIFSQISNS